MDAPSPGNSPQFPKRNGVSSIILAMLVVLLICAGSVLGYQYGRFRSFTATQSAPIPTPKPSGTTSPAEFLGQVKNAGPISGIKTVNTDQWKVSNGTVTENKSLNYSFQYPEKLYMVPNVRPGFKALYFFENQDGYNKYVSCIQDKTPSQGSGGGGGYRDWEGGCDREGNLLFTVMVNFSEERTTSLNKASDLTSYSGWGENITWTIPQKNKILYGMVASYYADGQTPSGWISLRVTPASESRIQSVVGIDSYTLFTHIVASFKIVM